IASVSAGIASFAAATSYTGSGLPRSLLAGEASEYGRKRNAEAREIAVAEHIRRHDHAGREHIARGPAILLHDPHMIIDGNAEMRERHAWPQRVGGERRNRERDRGVRFRRR